MLALKYRDILRERYEDVAEFVEIEVSRFQNSPTRNPTLDEAVESIINSESIFEVVKKYATLSADNGYKMALSMAVNTAIDGILETKNFNPEIDKGNKKLLEAIQKNVDHVMNIMGNNSVVWAYRDYIQHPTKELEEVKGLYLDVKFGEDIVKTVAEVTLIETYTDLSYMKLNPKEDYIAIKSFEKYGDFLHSKGAVEEYLNEIDELLEVEKFGKIFLSKLNQALEVLVDMKARIERGSIFDLNFILTKANESTRAILDDKYRIPLGKDFQKYDDDVFSFYQDFRDRIAYSISIDGEKFKEEDLYDLVKNLVNSKGSYERIEYLHNNDDMSGFQNYLQEITDRAAKEVINIYKEVKSNVDSYFLKIYAPTTMIKDKRKIEAKYRPLN